MMKKKILIKNNILFDIVWADYENIIDRYLSKKNFLIIDSNINIENEFRKKFKSVFSIDTKTKDQKLFERIINFFYNSKADRDSSVVCMGGGVLSDVCGFACSVWMRGLNLILIPTSFLSQIDASVGGKTAIDFKSKRNLIGTFYFPSAVIIDISLTMTQKYADYIQGFGEIFKYMIISKKLYTELSGLIDGIIKRDPHAVLNATKICLSFKSEIIQKDPFDRKGIREILNFGHTIAHAIESVSKIPHGDAVFAGCLFELILSEKLNFLTRKELKKHIEIASLKELPDLSHINHTDIINAIEYDKKNNSSKNAFMIISKKGIKKITDLDRKTFIEIWRRICKKKYL